jgi:hypothetical protein
LEEFISVNASPSDVERHLTTESLAQQWISSLVVLEPLEGEWMRVGSKYMLRFKTLGLLVVAQYTVAERDSEHILLNFEGAVQGTNRWRWFKQGNATIVHNRIEYEVSNPGLRVFVENLGSLFAQLDMRVQMSTLREMAEGRMEKAKTGAQPQMTSQQQPSMLQSRTEQKVPAE